MAQWTSPTHNDASYVDGIMAEYPSVVAVTLVGNPNQMDPTNAADYTGYATFPARDATCRMYKPVRIA
jgi:hypothetical protein